MTGRKQVLPASIMGTESFPETASAAKGREGNEREAWVSPVKAGLRSPTFQRRKLRL